MQSLSNILLSTLTTHVDKINGKSSV